MEICVIYGRHHKNVPVPYSFYDRKTLSPIKCYDPIMVQIVIILHSRAIYTGK